MISMDNPLNDVTIACAHTAKTFQSLKIAGYRKFEEKIFVVKV